MSRVLEDALRIAEKRGIPVILASTTGATASQMLDSAQGRKVRLIVVTHNARNVAPSLRFSADVLQRLERGGHVFFQDSTLAIPVKWARRITRLLGVPGISGKKREWEKAYGTGGRVCFSIAEQAVEKGLLTQGEEIVAVGGKESGANIALLLRVAQRKPATLEVVDIIAGGNARQETHAN